VAEPISGRQGRLYIDTSVSANGSAQPISNLSSFDIQQTADRTETTYFGSVSKQYVAGLRDAQGSFSGYHDTDGGLVAIDTSVARKFYLYPSTAQATKYWFGTATFDITVSQTVNGAVETSGSWAAASGVEYQSS
jgi:hypothetical protein